MATDRVNNGPTITPPALTPLQTPAAPEVQKGQKAKRPDASAAPSAGAGETGKKNYDVQISDQAKSKADAFQKALGIARATPDVREDRVAALKKQIADGTYQVDSGKVADGMLLEAIKDHLAERER
jgi:negative regulator of flagellin synthesis FlgM